MIFDVMFFGGIIFTLVFLMVSIILFKKNHVATLAKDLLRLKKGPVVYEVQEETGSYKELVTDVLVSEEVCVEQFFKVVDDVVVTHTKRTIEERSCL